MGESDRAARPAAIHDSSGLGAVGSGTLKRALMGAAGGAALLILDQSAAWAACSPAAVNSVTALCSGAISTVYGSGTQTNGSITVDATGAINVAGSNAFNFGSISLLDNYGSIAATAAVNADASAIGAYTAAVTLNNYAGASITATSSGSGAAYTIYGKTNVTVNSNSGTISATASGNGYAEPILAVGDAQVTNSAGGVIQAIGGSSIAYGVNGTNVTVNNAGSITAQTNAAGAYAEGVRANGDIHVTNSAGAVISAVNGTS